ncbi:MAG: hypothetical protein JJU18_01875 [Oceanicaulis sp.]|nr:hypothetical protein [Oceanicaulis sp.]
MTIPPLCAAALRTGALSAALAAIALMAAPPALAQDADALFAQGQRYLEIDNRIDGRIALRSACELDHIEACKAYGDDLNVSTFFGDSEAVQDRFWAYGRACDLGDGEGCMKLGNAQAPDGMFGGRRTPENWAGGAAAYRRACDEHAIAEACFRLDEVLGHHANPNRNAMAGRTYRDRACELGLQAACNVSANERAAVNVRAREEAAIEEHERLYGPTDSRVPVGQAFYDVLEQILRSDGRTTWSEAKVTALRRHILADGAVDSEERGLIAELTYPRLRVFNIYPSSQPDPFSGVYLATSPVSGEALRSSLLALLDHTPMNVRWDDADRQGSLRRLAEASLAEPGMTDSVRDQIADHARLAAEASTLENSYGPIRLLISDMLSTANAMQSDGGVDDAGYSAVRQLFHDAIAQGVEGAPVAIPGFLYSWLRPSLAAAPASPGVQTPQEQN